MSRKILIIAVLALAAIAATALIRKGGRPADPLRAYQPRPQDTLTFNQDVAPIVFENCAPCHRPGESAPFDLLTYQDVKRHAAQIVDVTTSGFMPPWLPEPGYGVFAGERRLSVDQIGMIKQWVAEGGTRGDPDDLPPPPEFTEGWQIGEPDLIIEMSEPYTLAPGGEDTFRNFVYPTDLDRIRYVRALEFRPANAKSIHHTTIAVDRTPKSRYHDQKDEEPGFDGMINSSAQRPDGHMLGWVPGKLPHAVPDEIAWRLDQDSDLIVQLHLQPSGKAETMRPRVGLYFADEPPTRTPFMIRLGPQTIDIPPGEKSYAIEDIFVLPVDVEVLGLVPHAHYLGKQMQGYATLPDGTREWLLWIKDWDFNWQDEYRFAEPVFLPAGSTLAMRFTYDNSEDNVRNPSDPPVRVFFGPRTDNEMGDLWIQVLPRREEDLAILRREFMRKERQANRSSYETMLKQDPDDVTVRYELGEMLQQQGSIGEAVEHLRRVLEIDPDHVPASAAMGRALHAQGKAGEAIEHFRRALRLMPELAELHYNLGQSLRVTGQLDEAIAEFGVTIEMRPDNAPAHHGLGEALRAHGRLDEAVVHYRRSLEIDPDYAQAHNNLGSVFAVQGKLDEALQHFALALEIDPGRARAHNNMGMALASRGRLDEAIEHFRRAVELRPDHAPSRRNLEIALKMKQQGPGAGN